MKQGAGAARRAPPLARNKTRLVKTAAELKAFLNIKTRYGDVSLKDFENFTVFDRIWLYLTSFDRSRTIKKLWNNDQERSRTIKKSEKKNETIKDDQGRSKNKVVNFRGSIYI